MRVLVTRPRADSVELVAELADRGHTASIEPLLDIRVRDVTPDSSGVQALLITSANGVRAFAELSQTRDLPVLTVGEASAEAARKAGFKDVISADGDAQALARLAIDTLDPADGTLFHAAGTVTAGELEATLSAADFDVRRTPLYEAVPAENLSSATRTALESGTLDAVLFFSPRTAKVFVRLLYEEGITHVCRGIEAVCLSQAVASALQGIVWAGVRVAERPERAALLAALDAGPPAAPDSSPADAWSAGSNGSTDRPSAADAPAPPSAPSTTAPAGTKDAMTQHDKDDGKPTGSKPDGGAHDDGPTKPAGQEPETGDAGGAPGAEAPAEGGAAAAGPGGESGPHGDDEPADPSANAALAVIQRFGGIRPMAHKLGMAVSTVQGWKNRGAIPESRHDEILAAARANNIDLDRSLLRASGEETVAEAEPAGTSPWARRETAEPAEPETVDAEEVDPEAEAAQRSDAHAAGAEAEAASVSGPEGEAQPSSWAAAPAAQPRRARGWLPGMFLGAAIVIVGVGGAIYTRDVWQPYLPAAGDQPETQPASQQALDELQTTVSDLASQVAGLRDQLGTVQQTAQDAASTAESAAETAQSAADTADDAGEAAQAAQQAAKSAQETAQQAADAAAAGGGEAGQQVAQLQDRVGALESRLQEATGRLETLAGRLDAGAGGGGGGGASAQRLETLASRVDELSSKLEQARQQMASREAVQSLSDRLSEVEGRGEAIAQLQEKVAGLSQQQAGSAGTARTAAAQQAAQALAVAELRDALRFSSPFAQQLEAARQVIPGDGPLKTALDRLQPYAERGVPTRAELSSAFDRAAGRAVAADMGASQDGMLGGVLRRLNDVITVRRVDASAEGSGTDARLAQAETKLAAGDLNEAVQIVEQLPDPALAEMQPWLEQARARMAAEQALSALSSQLMSTLAGAAGGGAAGSGNGDDGSDGGSGN
jgi:uroporphyrinogen-III synthase